MMPRPAISNLTPPLDYTGIAKRHRDGSVLLSIADDRIWKLNGVGALTWMILEESPAALSVHEVVRTLSEKFEAINSEGELRYEVAPDKLLADIALFLKNMTQMNLLQTMTNSAGQQVYCIKEGVSGTTSASFAAAAVARNTTTSSHTESTQASSIEPADGTSAQIESRQPTRPSVSESSYEDIKVLKRDTLTAFFGLAAFDLLLKLLGFRSLISRVEHWPISKPRRTDREICQRVRAMVDRAQMYYPKKVMCLQHSAVVTCLLRRRGVPAEMVLTAQEFPLKAHAWAEVEGEVVNDSAQVKTKYRELKRV